MRKYPVPRRKPAPEDATPADRREFRSNLRKLRPDATKWQTEHGVGDTVTYTGACQRDGCGSWFSVDRTPADVTGRWPEFCSESCREIHSSVGARRRTRKLRSGETDGRKRPKHQEFDPEAMTIVEAVELAETIVDGPPSGLGWDRWASNRTYRLAAEYLDRYEQESASYRA